MYPTSACDSGTLMLPMATPLILGAIISAIGITVGIRRSRLDLGYVDFFHPLVFPLGYSAVSLIAPAWVFFVDRRQIGLFNASAMSPSTPWILLLAILGITLGLARRSPNLRQSVRAVPVEPRFVLHTGRGTVVALSALALSGLASNAVATRGVDQLSAGGGAFLASLATVATPLALLFVLTATRQRTDKLVTAGDALLLVTLTIAIALTGERGTALTALIILLYAASRKAFKLRSYLGAFAGMLTLAVVILDYRIAAQGAGVRASAADALLRDWSVGTYTTGITADVAAESGHFYWGATYLTAVMRQLPSPIANTLLGSPDDTGTLLFRQMIGFHNPDHGLGYSIPAEGYLNFGAIGTFVAMLLFGSLVAWAYSVREWPVQRTRALLFPLLVSTFPVLLRSDTLGGVKMILYPMLGGALILAISRTIRSQQRRGRRLAARLRLEESPTSIPPSDSLADSGSPVPGFRAAWSPGTVLQRGRTRT